MAKRALKTGEARLRACVDTRRPILRILVPALSTKGSEGTHGVSGAEDIPLSTRTASPSDTMSATLSGTCAMFPACEVVLDRLAERSSISGDANLDIALRSHGGCWMLQSLSEKGE